MATGFPPFPTATSSSSSSAPAAAGTNTSPQKPSPMISMEGLTPMMSNSPSMMTRNDTSPLNAMKTPGNSGNAAASNLLSRARLAAGLNASSPYGTQPQHSDGVGMFIGQTPMPSTSTLLPPAVGASKTSLIEEECDEFERALALLEHLGDDFYAQLANATSESSSSAQVQASLQTLLTNLESLMAWTSQTSIGGVPLAGEDTSQQTTTISDEISLLSDQGSTLYNQLRGVRDASGVVASVLSGGRAR